MTTIDRLIARSAAFVLAIAVTGITLVSMDGIAHQDTSVKLAQSIIAAGRG